MGVNLGEIISSEEIQIESLKDKILAIDAMNTLYQFLTVIRQFDGTPLKDSKGNITSHLSGLFYRTINWMEKGIKPVFVFDGKSPELKKRENIQRFERREEAKKEYLRLMDEGKLKEAMVKAMQSVKLTQDMVQSAKELLDGMGIPYIQAKSEGEAQAAFMNKINQVYGIVSQDYDSLLFGGKILIKNLSTVGRKKVPRKYSYIKVNPEAIYLDKVLCSLNLEHEKLIWLAILVGTDFNPKGVRGIGPKKALKLVRETNSFESLLKKIEWNEENDPHEILEFFKNPPVESVDFTFKEPSPEKIKKILVEKYEFSQDRIQSGIDKMIYLRKNVQTGLGRFTRQP